MGHWDAGAARLHPSTNHSPPAGGEGVGVKITGAHAPNSIIRSLPAGGEGVGLRG
jgi:hypothetical protein